MQACSENSEVIAESLLANLPCVVFRCEPDQQRRLLFLSGAIETLTGYAPEAFLQGTRQLIDLLPEDERHRLSPGSPEAIMAGVPGGTHFRLRHRGGALRQVWESSRACADSQGRVLHIDGILLDVSDRAAVDASSAKALEPVETPDHESKFSVAAAAPYQAPLARILLAEDNPTNQLVTREILARRGYLVDAVASGAAALEALRSASYDLVLMDIAMPELDGIETTRAIRALPGAAGSLPVLALTAHAQPKDMEAFLESGIDAVVAKPIVTGHRLLEAVGRALMDRRGEAVAPEPMGEGDGASNPNVFDPAVLLRLAVAVGPEAMDRLRRSFPQDLRKGLVALDKALNDGNVDGLQRASHLLKSISGTFGATELHRLSSEINDDCMELAGPQVFEKARQLEAAVGRAFEAFHLLFGEPGWGLRISRCRPVPGYATSSKGER